MCLHLEVERGVKPCKRNLKMASLPHNGSIKVKSIAGTLKPYQRSRMRCASSFTAVLEINIIMESGGDV